MSRTGAHPDRRRFLAGGAAALALPWLESRSLLGSTAGRPEEAPLRLLFVFFPNGVLDRHYRPRQTGADFELPYSLEPLAPHRDRLMVLSGLYNAQSLAGEGHYVKTTALLSGAAVRRTGGRDLRCGRTVDQVIAEHLGRRTPLPSLDLSIEPVTSTVDMGYSTVYGAHISWKSADQPVAREVSPRRAFDRLFRSSRLAGSVSERRVVDLVRAEARILAGKLGHSDREKLDGWVDGIDELERRIAILDGGQERERRLLAGLERPEAEPPTAHQDRVELMFDLIAAAFRSDSTRVASFMFGNAVSNRDFSFLEGVKGGHHDFSHHENKKEKEEAYARIVRWHAEMLGKFMTRLRGIPEGDSDLLERTLIVFASSIRDGNSHDPHDLPIILAGGAGGRIRKGEHRVFPRHSPLCGLHADLLTAAGLPSGPFGDAEKGLGIFG